LSDNDRADNDRRTPDIEHGDFILEFIFAPELFSGLRVIAAKGALYAQRHDLSIGNSGRASRTGVARGAAARRFGFVLVLPDLLAGFGVEAANDFVPAFAREDEHAVAHDRRCRHAVADGDFPILREFGRPILGRVEAAGSRISIGASPLGPILPYGVIRRGPKSARANESEPQHFIFHTTALCFSASEAVVLDRTQTRQFGRE
jgi:hypothetical protein